MVADLRVHGTTGEAPIDRFLREEAGALRAVRGIPPFTTHRDLMRSVGADCAVAIDGNAYSVPWRLIGERVRGHRRQRDRASTMAGARWPSMPS